MLVTWILIKVYQILLISLVLSSIQQFRPVTNYQDFQLHLRIHLVLSFNTWLADTNYHDNQPRHGIPFTLEQSQHTTCYYTNYQDARSHRGLHLVISVNT